MFRILAALSLVFLLSIPVYADDPKLPADMSVPLDQPGADDAAITSWAALAVADFMSLSYQDHERRLAQAAGYFTKRGWKNYVEALQRSHTLDSVIAQSMTLAARVKSAPVVVQKGVFDGKFRWVLAMPVVLTYKSAANTRLDALRVNLVIERAPSEEIPSGLGIVQFIATVDTPAEVADAVEYHPPGRLMASAIGNVVATGPSDKPGLDGDALLSWAAAAAVRASTFSFADFEESLDAAKKDFTPGGWASYQAALTKSGLPKSVIEHQYLVTTAPADKPAMVREEVKDGVYQWSVGVTLLRTSRAGASKTTDKVPVVLIITRTAGAPGIAISGWLEGK